MEYMRTGDDLSVSLPADSSPGRGAEGAGVRSKGVPGTLTDAYCLLPVACCLTFTGDDLSVSLWLTAPLGGEPRERKA